MTPFRPPSSNAASSAGGPPEIADHIDQLHLCRSSARWDRCRAAYWLARPWAATRAARFEAMAAAWDAQGDAIEAEQQREELPTG
ncbi:hypothetical protein CPCC7001_1438 [Cyanobium sp. PCC 7001]|nr:hypothetical protein CPCC7001_1438 [Cyanobium sp. PCC 7001]